MESPMASLIKLSQPNAWIQVKLSYKATLATTDGIQFGYTGKWEMVAASSADRYTGLESINPDYKNWLLYKGKGRHAMFFLNTIEVTGGGAMDLTDGKRFVYNKGDGSVENIVKLIIDAAITTFGYVENVFWVPGATLLRGAGTGFVGCRGSPWPQGKSNGRRRQGDAYTATRDHPMCSLPPPLRRIRSVLSSPNSVGPSP
jgi:hypothetical protein